mmetsp:Transcript_4597/g.6995  ORF Transcript_4597/g.6995 Transcript_4597/m.6995 type:complete len:213 (-) Transcript_4597:344-982(-)
MGMGRRCSIRTHIYIRMGRWAVWRRMTSTAKRCSERIRSRITHFYIYSIRGSNRRHGSNTCPFRCSTSWSACRRHCHSRIFVGWICFDSWSWSWTAHTVHGTDRRRTTDSCSYSCLSFLSFHCRCYTWWTLKTARDSAWWHTTADAIPWRRRIRWWWIWRRKHLLFNVVEWTGFLNVTVLYRTVLYRTALDTKFPLPVPVMELGYPVLYCVL